ncbi:MAG: hypothetical protein Q9164_000331 [Protoblastenia rupestris]
MATTHVPSSSDSEEDDSSEIIQRLTERLESLKRLKDEVDRQIEDEEAEAKINNVYLARERDRLKQELKEEEKASAELKRHGNHLDKLNRTAQSKKAAKEKLLQQRKAERQKVQDDCEKWDQEVIGMNSDIEVMDRELKAVAMARDKDIAEMRQGIGEDQDIIKSIEEEIRITSAEIRELEQWSERIHANGGNEQETAKANKDKDETWEVRYQNMQTQLSSMWQTLQQSKVEEQGAEERLSSWLAKRARNPEQFFPISALDLPPTVQRIRSKRSRQASSRGSNLSNPGYFGVLSNHGGPPTPYHSGSSFYPIGSGIAGSSGFDQAHLSHNDTKVLTSAATVSPAASDLLPSNLFRDDDIFVQPLPAMNDGSAGADEFAGHAVSTSDVSARGPHTPISTSSRGGSVLASPHDSMHNLSGFPPDSDRQSIYSANAPINSPLTTDLSSQPTSRLANLFSSPFGRQRGKSSAQEPPLLGTLKQGQSQSFPRNLEQDTFDAAGVRRRRGSHGNWAKPMVGLLARHSGDPEDGLIRARTGSGRSSRLNMFKPRMDALDPNAVTENEPSSSRPSSTYSFDQPFGRPSNESQRIWGPFPENLPNRSSPLGAYWASNHGPWSKVPSRRSSMQHGSTTNLSVGSTPLDTEEMPGSLSKYRSDQAPIGTRPQFQQVATPKLNPAAPSFKTIFSRSEARKAAKNDKASSRHSDTARETDSERGGLEGNEFIEDASSPNPRLSRDAQSITTAVSTADSHDSFERAASGAASDMTTPSGHKESLMQKITRKSSLSKFNVPWSKDRSIFSKRTGEPSTPGEIEECNTSEGPLSKSADSAASTPNTPQEKTGRAWPSMRRKSKKGDIVEKGSEPGDEDE